MNNKLEALMSQLIIEWTDMQEPRWANDACHYVSRHVINLLRRHGFRPKMGRCDILCHHWVVVDGHQIDFTARQYSIGTEWPLIWREGEEHPCLEGFKQQRRAA
jgi:hypothetical protein